MSIPTEVELPLGDVSPSVPRSILLIEDDPDMSEMLNQYLTNLGYKVTIANWGGDGVRISQENNPDLVLLDIRLPDIDGFEVYRQLRTRRNTHTLPVIFLTERDQRSDRLQGLAMGATDYITKPFDIQELGLRIRNTLDAVTWQTQRNAITGLPEGEFVTRQIATLLNVPDRAMLRVQAFGLDDFAERFGFVAADDVLRAISLTIERIVDQEGTHQDIVGHLDPHTLVVLTRQQSLEKIRQQIHKSLTPRLKYFLPSELSLTDNDIRLTLQVEIILEGEVDFPGYLHRDIQH